jgi:uncharacterized protein
MGELPSETPIKLTMPDGACLRGVFKSGRRDKAVPAVVFAHGFGSTRNGEKAQALEAECKRREWAFAACDFRGHGQSGGSPANLRGSNLIEDLDAVTQWVAQRTDGPLFLMGSSMGGWAAAWLLASAPERAKACALVAPAFHFLEFRGLSKSELDDWRRTGRRIFKNGWMDVEVGYGLVEESRRFPVAKLAARFQTPLIIFHGMRDEVIPYNTSIEFAANCAATNVELHLLKEGDHRFNLAKREMALEACDFFERSLPHMRDSQEFVLDDYNSPNA